MTWGRFGAEAPELAAAVKSRFESAGIAFLGTLRRDGSPRLTMLHPMIEDGDIWLSMMAGSRKAADVLRDPRLTLHAASVDPWVKEGDAKLSGRGIPVADDDEEQFERWAAGVRKRKGWMPPRPFPLFRIEMTDASFLRAGSGVLVVEVWRPGRGVRQHEIH